MTSAFGIDHGISKSFVPGKGYKAAKDLDLVERHIVRNKTIGNLKSMKATGTPEQKAPSSKGRQIYSDHKTARGTLTRVLASRKQTRMPRGVEGFSQPDGRGGGRVFVHDDADFATTSRHEMAHIAPRRNPVRMNERFRSDETRLGREEGRADFLAHGRQSTGSYPGSDKFKRGYNEVQGKMASAQWRKKKFG